MIAYLGNRKIGEVFSSFWRPSPDGKFIVGSIVFDNADGFKEAKEDGLQELAILEIRNGESGIIKFQGLNVLTETLVEGDNYFGISFEAEAVIDWKPIR